MQTFVPSIDPLESVRVLDNKRLGKQRLECKQILSALMGWTDGYLRHPATRMWAQDIPSLAYYASAACEEYVQRGFADSLGHWFTETFHARWVPPAWWGDDDVHQSHRSSLLRKDFGHYAEHFRPRCTATDLVYVWPETSWEDRNAYTVRVSKPDLKRVSLGERSLPPGLAGEPVLRYRKGFVK